ncbi:MAG: arsenate reductase (glutaredoxin) [Brumimicrobium sp.]|nr:arsenate reductase (glutaredoxin) [Brumimicrobium sp.]
MKIFHNPRCSKSRQTLELIRKKGVEPEVILYLENSPNADELRNILKKLQIPAEKLVRRGEQEFKDRFKGKDLSEAEWIEAMVNYPKLIERPIVIKENKAVIGRPPESVLELL